MIPILAMLTLAFSIFYICGSLAAWFLNSIDPEVVEDDSIFWGLTSIDDE